MLDAWGDHPVVQQTLQEASEALGENIGQLIHEGPKEALGLTTNTQPVMLVSAIAAYRVWLSEGGAQPSVVSETDQWRIQQQRFFLTPLARLQEHFLQRRCSPMLEFGKCQVRMSNRL